MVNWCVFQGFLQILRFNTIWANKSFFVSLYAFKYFPFFCICKAWIEFLSLPGKARFANTHFFFFRILETDFYNPESSSTISQTAEADKSSGVQGVPTKLEQRSSHAYLRGPGGPAPDKFRGGRYHDDYRPRPRHQYRNPQFNQDSWVFFFMEYLFV